MGKRRLTNNNCKMPCSGILGSVRLGRLKAPTPHSTTFFCLRETASQFPLSQTKKRQLFRTLCVSCAGVANKIFLEYNVIK